MNRILVLIFCFMAVVSCNCAPKGGDGEMSFDEVIRTRRSVRSYDASRSISQESVRTLIETALQAPSWANTESSRYYVVMQDAEKLEALKKLTLGNYERIAGAPVLIVSTYVKGLAGHRQGVPVDAIADGWGAYDNGLSNAYFILKARQMGFDTLIMGMRDSAGIRALLNIPEEEVLMAVISLGYRDGEPRYPARKQVDEVSKFF